MSSFENCTEVTPQCPVEATTYGYYPNLGANAFLLAAFGLAFFAQIIVGWKTKVRAFTTVVAIGCGMEALGYGGRIIMNDNPWSSDGFKMQVCCLILAPSFLAAGFYLTIKHIVMHLGSEYSRLSPRWYTWIFIGCDLISILMQAAGGGIASATDTGSLLDVGNALMIAGIAFQVVTMFACIVLTVDFGLRLSRKRSNAIGGPMHDRKFIFYLCLTSFGFLSVFIRCVYRLPEMAGGWGSALMRKEVDFMVLDGMMILIACICMTVAHPGIYFPTISSRGRAAALSNGTYAAGEKNGKVQMNSSASSARGVEPFV